MDWFQIGKAVHQSCILSPCLFNFYAEYTMQNARLDEAQAGIWNQDYWDKYQPQIYRWHHPYGRKWRGTKEPLDENERGEWKRFIKTQRYKNEDCGIQPDHFMQIDGESMETVTDFIFLGSKIPADGDHSNAIKNTCSLEEEL